MMLRKFLILLCTLFFSLTVNAKLPLEGRELTVLIDYGNAPMTFFPHNFQEPEGIDIDIIRELQKRLGFRLKENRYFVVSRAKSVEMIQNKTADVAAGGLSVTESRKEVLDYGMVYYVSGLGLIYSSKAGYISSAKSPQLQAVASIPGTTGFNYIEENMPSVRAVPMSNIISGYFQISKGQVDGMIYDYHVIKYFADTVPELGLRVLDELLAPDQIAFGFQKDSDIRPYFDEEMQKMKIDGTLDAIIKKYLSE